MSKTTLSASAIKEFFAKKKANSYHSAHLLLLHHASDCAREYAVIVSKKNAKLAHDRNYIRRFIKHQLFDKLALEKGRSIVIIKESIRSLKPLDRKKISTFLTIDIQKIILKVTNDKRLGLQSNNFLTAITKPSTQDATNL